MGSKEQCGTLTGAEYFLAPVLQYILEKEEVQAADGCLLRERQ